MAQEQKPYATIVTCSDSRVSPELIFDEELGRLFVVRIAGNVVDNFAVGTVEYGVQHLQTPLLVVLGHQSCGAVKATRESKGNFPFKGDVPHLMKEISACCEEQVDQDALLDLDAMVQKNVRRTKKKLLKNEAVRELVERKELKVVLAEYYLDTGRVCEISDEETDVKKVFFGDVVSVKHAKSGAYLCGADGKVFTAVEAKTQWVVRPPCEANHYKQGNPISEGAKFRLELRGTGKHLLASKEGHTGVGHGDFLENLHLSLQLKGSYPEMTLREGSFFSIQHLLSYKFFSSTSHEVRLADKKDFFVLETIVEKAPKNFDSGNYVSSNSRMNPFSFDFDIPF